MKYEIWNMKYGGNALPAAAVFIQLIPKSIIYNLYSATRGSLR